MVGRPDVSIQDNTAACVMTERRQSETTNQPSWVSALLSSWIYGIGNVYRDCHC